MVSSVKRKDDGKRRLSTDGTGASKIHPLQALDGGYGGRGHGLDTEGAHRLGCVKLKVTGVSVFVAN